MSEAILRQWRLHKMGIDFEIDYPQGIVTYSRVGVMHRIAWKCDDATFKIGVPRIEWKGWESTDEQTSATRLFEKKQDLIRSYGLEPTVITL